MQYDQFNGEHATINVSATTGAQVEITCVDSHGDVTCIDLSYEQAVYLAERLVLAAELVGKPKGVLESLYEAFAKPSLSVVDGGGDGAA